MPDLNQFPLLANISSPNDFRHFSNKELTLLAQEVRDYLLETVNKTGGHLSSGLGVTELTIALHYVFDTPEDKLIWDVGHQCYPHKMLTGRLGEMHSIRSMGGISGFPRPQESDYDCFAVGHSSTSISAALGMSVANELTQPPEQAIRKHIAVIGDGAITSGMAFEALNHGGDIHADLLVILNDNNMSISPNVGGLSNHFANIISSKLYMSVRENSKKILSNMPSMWELAKRTEEHMKGMLVPGTLFEELGFTYFGPIDGHNMSELVNTLKNIQSIKGPCFLHIVTRKGNGYSEAEADPVNYHAVTAGYYSNNHQQQNPVNAEHKKTFTEVFSKWICEKAEQDERLIGITPAMKEGSGLVEFANLYPKRYFDVAIAEQHAVTFAAGASSQGLKPVVAIYSSFLQRAYDQLIHDVALQKLAVIFAIDRAGLVGPDGATHTGNFDLSFLRCIPNMVVMAPANENECYQMLDFAFSLDQPVAVRYPRGKGCGETINTPLKQPIELGKGQIALQAPIQPNNNKLIIKVAILNFGTFLHHALNITEQLNAQGIILTIADLRFVKPIDEELIKDLACKNQYLFTLEDNVLMGGAGSAVNEVLASVQPHPKVHNFALPDQFPEHASQQQLYQKYQLDSEGLFARILQITQS